MVKGKQMKKMILTITLVISTLFYSPYTLAVDQTHEKPGKETPEYYIEKDLVLPQAVFREVVSEITYKADSGNEIADQIENKKHWNRFRGKSIVVEGIIRRISATFFTDRVKCIIDAHGRTISARFDSMSKSEGAKLRPGTEVTVQGVISDRPVLSDIAMDNCVFR